MVIRSATLPARYLRPFLDHAGSLGLPPGEVLRRAAIPVEALEDPAGWVNLDTFGRLVGAVIHETGHEDVGLDVGRRITLTTHGLFGMALMRCADLHEALELHARHYAEIAPAFAVEYQRGRDRATLRFRPVAGMAHAMLRTLNEVQLASFHSIVTSLAGGRLPPFDAWHSTERPRYAERYEQLPGARVHFGQTSLPELRIEFEAGLTEIALWPLPRPHARGSRDNLARGPRVHPIEATWCDWVRLMLREANGCLPTLEQVAAVAGLSPQRLARRLAREGESYRCISNAARLERAIVLLRERRLPIARISDSLGYGSAANFSTAFRRATGVTPRRFRKSQAFH